MRPRRKERQRVEYHLPRTTHRWGPEPEVEQRLERRIYALDGL